MPQSLRQIEGDVEVVLRQQPPPDQTQNNCHHPTQDPKTTNPECFGPYWFSIVIDAIWIFLTAPTDTVPEMGHAQFFSGTVEDHKMNPSAYCKSLRVKEMRERMKHQSPTVNQT